MSKGPTTIYACTNCDSQYPKWAGRCSECGQWGTLVAQVKSAAAAQATGPVATAKTVGLHTLTTGGHDFIDVEWPEVNRVLGGGFVPGSLVLLGGDPGIGKSTLVLQLVSRMSRAGKKILYVSGEESVGQVGARWQRLASDKVPLDFAAETNVETIVSTMQKDHPDVMVVDSIQTMNSAQAPNDAGSVGQVRAVTTQLMAAAKASNTAIILIGHVTKDGAMAGPKALEHLVDVVLYIEGDPLSSYRLLRSTKNRFGSTNEVGVFDMTEKGLVEVANPSAAFLSQRQNAPGAIATIVMEGTRPFGVEVQALVSPTVFGLPRRTAAGVDANRLHVLIAVLSKRGGVNLASADVFMNVVGGLKLQDRSADLALCLAIASSSKDIPIPPTMAAVGEVGLGGEIRRVSHLERRLKEAAQVGFTKVLVPAGSEIPKEKKLEMIQVATISDALRSLNGKTPAHS